MKVRRFYLHSNVDCFRGQLPSEGVFTHCWWHRSLRIGSDLHLPTKGTH